ncbi:MAG: alanine dehydrogenase [Clostridia bacterium]|nr:alanine dehydrogenase [Clostridia bacterium]
MIIGIPKETKNWEKRVAAIPDAVSELVRSGHTVLVEKDAGAGAGFLDSDYKKVGAEIVDTDKVYTAEMIYKVKEVLPHEYKYYNEGQILFTYIHSAAHPEQSVELMKRKIVGIAYEDVTDAEGRLPLLAPMSEMAGKGGFLAAVKYLETLNGGCGLLLSRVCGAPTPHVVIFGCGGTGMGAAEYAAAFGNRVTILDISKKSMDRAKGLLPENVEFLFANRDNVLEQLKTADVLINCVLWQKTRKDHMVYREDLKLMKHGAVIIDVACDDNGAIETCRSTTHDDPVYYEEGILHYAVANIPSLFARTSSILLSNATLPYALEIANKGVKGALKDNKYLRNGLSFWYGKATLKECCDVNGYEYTSPDSIIAEF